MQFVFYLFFMCASGKLIGFHDVEILLKFGFEWSFTKCVQESTRSFQEASGIFWKLYEGQGMIWGPFYDRHFWTFQKVNFGRTWCCSTRPPKDWHIIQAILWAAMSLSLLKTADNIQVYKERLYESSRAVNRGWRFTARTKCLAHFPKIFSQNWRYLAAPWSDFDEKLSRWS